MVKLYQITVKIIISLFLILFAAPGFAENIALDKIFKINILGNQKIEKDAIYPYISSKTGDNFNLEKVKKDVSSIYRMGYFENVLVNISVTRK